MRMRPLFRGGPMVGEVGLSLSSPPTAWQPLRQLAMLAPASEDPAASGEDATAAAIRRALDLGVNLIDTDWITANGHAQEVLGRAGLARDSVIITSKAGPRLKFHGGLSIDNSRANLMNQCHDSLFRLKTDHIDLYQVHWPDNTPVEQTARGLRDLIDGGYTRWAGVCNYSLEQVKALHAILPLQTVQAPLNILNRKTLELLPWCVENGVGFLAADPTMSGLLTGQFAGNEEFPEDDEWFTQPKFAKAAEFARELVKLGDPLQLAIGWCLAQDVSSVLCPVGDVVEVNQASPGGATRRRRRLRRRTWRGLPARVSRPRPRLCRPSGACDSLAKIPRANARG
jgi:aryl-alcohol dehydrogenase-like predicted oxidoreductase